VSADDDTGDGEQPEVPAAPAPTGPGPRPGGRLGPDLAPMAQQPTGEPGAPHPGADQ
jgi:hypothetical protein